MAGLNMLDLWAIPEIINGKTQNIYSCKIANQFNIDLLVIPWIILGQAHSTFIVKICNRHLHKHSELLWVKPVTFTSFKLYQIKGTHARNIYMPWQ